MACLFAGPGRFWVDDEPELSWPACGFGQRWNGWDSPRVDQCTLVQLVGHLLLEHRKVVAFNLDRDGIMNVMDDEERNHWLVPDQSGYYDLIALDLVCYRSPAAAAGGTA